MAVLPRYEFLDLMSLLDIKYSFLDSYAMRLSLDAKFLTPNVSYLLEINFAQGMKIS